MPKGEDLLQSALLGSLDSPKGPVPGMPTTKGVTNFSPRQIYQIAVFQVAISRITEIYSPIQMVKTKRLLAKNFIKDAIEMAELVGEAYDELITTKPEA